MHPDEVFELVRQIPGVPGDAELPDDTGGEAAQGREGQRNIFRRHPGEGGEHVKGVVAASGGLVQVSAMVQQQLHKL